MNTSLPTKKILYTIFDDILWDSIGINDGPFSLVNSTVNGGGGSLEGSPSDNSYSGMYTISHGSWINSSGKSSLVSSNNNNRIMAGGSLQLIEWRVRIPILSGSPGFDVKVGIQSSTGTGDPANGIYFQYSDDINGGNWIGVTRNSSTSTVVNSSVTVSANTWYKLRFIINSAGNLVQFYINNTLIGTSSTNIPTTNACAFMCSIDKNQFTLTSRSMDIDYLYYKVEK